MAKTIISELPRIASEGRRRAQNYLERLAGGTRIGLQTNELVLPYIAHNNRCIHASEGHSLTK